MCSKRSGCCWNGALTSRKSRSIGREGLEGEGIRVGNGVDFRAVDRAKLAGKLKEVATEIHYAPWLRNAEVVLRALADSLMQSREKGLDYRLAVRAQLEASVEKLTDERALLLAVLEAAEAVVNSKDMKVAWPAMYELRQAIERATAQVGTEGREGGEGGNG